MEKCATPGCTDKFFVTMTDFYWNQFSDYTLGLNRIYGIKIKSKLVYPISRKYPKNFYSPCFLSSLFHFLQRNVRQLLYIGKQLILVVFLQCLHDHRYMINTVRFTSFLIHFITADLIPLVFYFLCDFR